MSNVLIVSGHPRTGDDSVANKTILEELTSLLPEATIDHLDELYPDYVFDVEAEQNKLAAADVIVLQYPLWWYGWPSLLQKWMEDVFVRGFSHGSTGTALRGKKLVVSLTTGAAESYYDAQPGGIERFLAAVKATSALTGLEYAGVLPLYGVSYANRTDEAARATWWSVRASTRSTWRSSSPPLSCPSPAVSRDESPSPASFLSRGRGRLVFAPNLTVVSGVRVYFFFFFSAGSSCHIASTTSCNVSRSSTSTKSISFAPS